MRDPDTTDPDSHSGHSSPPQLAISLLSKLLPRRTVHEVLGDLEEVYAGRVTNFGHSQARRWYWGQTLRFITRLTAKSLTDLRSNFTRSPDWHRQELPGRSSGPRVQHEPPHRRDFPMSTLMHDIRYAGRTLVKEPGFSLVAVLILAVGIGANVAMFSVTDAVLLRALPFPDAERLVLARTSYGEGLGWNVSSPDYYDYRDQNQGLESLAAVRSFSGAVTVTGGDEPERVPGTLASVNFFPTLGVQPQLGRQFSADEAEL